MTFAPLTWRKRAAIAATSMFAIARTSAAIDSENKAMWSTKMSLNAAPNT